MESGTIVKVAFFPMGGYNETLPDGSYAGMDVEYLNALCSYTRWEIEYVPCDSWDDALALLKEKKVDLVGSAQYSEERAEIYSYADLPSGYTFGVVMVNPDSDIAYEDFAAMAKLRYGMVKTYVRQEEFRQYMREQGIDAPQILFYDNTAEVKAALDAGQIDAVVHTFTEISIGQRMIGRFAARPYYYITYQGNERVLRELNQGIADLRINRPDLENRLMERFYQSRLDKTIVFTTDEMEFVEAGHTIRVGYVDGCYPFSYVENGNFAGLTRNLLDRFARETGLRFEYVLEESAQTAEDHLAQGELDLLSYYVGDDDAMSGHGLVAVQQYADPPLVLIAGKKHPKTVRRLAMVPAMESYMEDIFASDVVEIQFYPTEYECLGAVSRGSADAAVCNGYQAEFLLSTDYNFHQLQIHSVLSRNYNLSMVMKAGANPELAGIITKAMPGITDREINEYDMQKNTFSLMVVDRFIRNHSTEIISGLLLLTILIVAAAHKMLSSSRKISRLMYMDEEMGITNQNYLLYHGSRRLAADRSHSYAIVFFDVAQIRAYSALFGLDASDRILKVIVRVLKEELVRPEELFSRSQGICFLMLLLDPGSEQELLERLSCIRERLQDEIFALSSDRMSIKMGVCRISPGQHDLRAALAYAIQAMSSLRDVHQNAIRVYDEELEQQLREEHKRENVLENVLDSADGWEQFETFYQPKVDIRTGNVVGAEAVARFHDPTDGGAIRTPDFFVPYFEKTGKVVELDFFILECVCRMIRKRLDEGKPVVTVSCNFSRRHFQDPGFPERFRSVVEKYRIPLELIEAEITETMALEDMQYRRMQQTICSMHEQGVRIAIDDFGSGYSSLSVLDRIPASVIKLDRSFLLNKEDHRRQVDIMKSIVALTHQMGAQIVCEGIETENDVALMYEIGAFVAQGYRYGRPMPESDFLARL